MLNQIFAHTHQRSGAARSQIETAEQLLAGRLHRPQERLKAARVRSLIVASPSGAKLLLVGVKVMRKKAKEVETLFHSKAGVEVEDLAGERHPRGFPAARQQIAAEGLEVLRRLCCLGCAPTSIRSGAGSRSLDQGAAAVSDAAQHIVEETCAHFTFNLEADWQDRSHRRPECSRYAWEPRSLCDRRPLRTAPLLRLRAD